MADNEATYVKAAFLWQYNLITLGGAALLSLVALNPVPALVALGAELVYLGVVPSLPGFKRRVRVRRDQERRLEQAESAEKMLSELSANQRDHYQELCELRDRLVENYRRMPGGSALAVGSKARIDALLASFVRLLHSLNNYRRYLGSTDKAAIEKELAELKAELSNGNAGTETLSEIKQRRVEILERRLERFEKAAESREIVAHQLASIDDFLRLLHEQSITARDPSALGAQLEHLATEIEATDQTVREMEKFAAITEEIHLPPAPEGQRVR